MVTVTSASQNHIFDDAKIIVIKVGSSLLVYEDQNAINTAWLSGIAADIARLKAAGKDVVVVSSGAIALGRRLLKIDHNKLKLKFKDSDKIEKNYSQCYQDLFVLFCTEGKKDGKYLEVGAGRPFYGNNTALLSKLGWKGVSIDFDKSLVDLWHKERSNDKCILEDATELDYNKLIKDSNLGNYIDYLQLDIDPAGNTFKVLEKIPFDNIEFGVITYEHDFYDDKNPKWRNKSREVLKEKGYTLIAANISPDENSPYEDWWVNTKYINDKVLKNIVNTSSNVLYVKNYIINSNNLLYSKK